MDNDTKKPKALLIELDSDALLANANAVLLLLQERSAPAPDGFDRKTIIEHLISLLMALEMVRRGAEIPGSLMVSIHSTVCQMIDDMEPPKPKPEAKAKADKFDPPLWIAKGPERAQ